MIVGIAYDEELEVLEVTVDFVGWFTILTVVLVGAGDGVGDDWLCEEGEDLIDVLEVGGRIDAQTILCCTTEGENDVFAVRGSRSLY